MKKTILALILCLLCVAVLTGCACEHEWEDADCVNPKYCPLCEETEGEPLGHGWVGATCEEPEHCKYCDETKGEALGHTEGTAELVSTDMDALTSTYEVTCVDCGKVLSTTTEDVTVLFSNGYFNITVNQYIDRLSTFIEENTTQYAFYYVNEGDWENAVSCDVISLETDNDYYTYSLFYDDMYTVKDYEADTPGIFSEVWTVLDCANENYDDAAATSLMIVLALDPMQDLTSASSLLSALATAGSITENGIHYTMTTGSGETPIFSASVAG